MYVLYVLHYINVCIKCITYNTYVHMYTYIYNLAIFNCSKDSIWHLIKTIIVFHFSLTKLLTNPYKNSYKNMHINTKP